MSRIIAGVARGRHLRMPPHRATRPTSDRVREAAFSLMAGWAGTAGQAADHALAGLAFLDLYAGSGAVALEAASRGAAVVEAIESDRGTAEIARRNVRETGLTVRVVTARVERVVAAPACRPFDIVWADPPYALATGDVARVLADLVTQGWVADGGLVMVERPARDAPLSWPAAMEETWNRGYGETTLYLATKGRTC